MSNVEQSKLTASFRNVAQLVEYTVWDGDVVGSIPAIPIALNGAKRLGALSVTRLLIEPVQGASTKR